MEEKKTLIAYGEQVFLIFGFTIFVIACMDAALGDVAKEHSTMFRLGSRGVPTATLFQYLGVSAVIVLLRVLFFTDFIVKKLSIPVRTLGMVVSVIGVIGLFAYWFGWFPVADPRCWGMFLCGFGICFALSAFLSVKKERMENQKLEQALKRRKEELSKEGRA